MFERFTSQGRTAVVHAQEEARMMRSPTILPLHLLIGLVLADGTARDMVEEIGYTADGLRERLTEQSDGIDADALADLGIDIGALRERVESSFGPGALDFAPKRWRGGHIPFADSSKAALKDAMQSAQDREHKSVGAAHMVLGIIAVDRQAVEALLGGAQTDQLESAARAELDSEAA